VCAVLFDYSGTLFRLEEDDSWFAGMVVDEKEVDGHVQAELMRRLTAPTGRSVEMGPEEYHAWVNRDLAPHLHREAYLHVLRESGMPEHHAESLYQRVITPACWTPYPDCAEVLRRLSERGIRTAVVSNIAFDVRPAFAAIGARPDEFVLRTKSEPSSRTRRYSAPRSNGWRCPPRKPSWSATATRPTAERARWGADSSSSTRCLPGSVRTAC
jgi:hypothetical protein